MRALRVLTWNVLHRIHAVNWGEAPVAAFPDERDRIAGIADAIAQWLATDVDAVCLQEVSGDQLAAVRRALDPGAHVFEHTYPRIPRLRRGGAPVLDDPTEHLVVIAKSPHARVREASTFDSDPGKGLLAVDLDDDVTLVCTHVSFGDRRAAQLERVARVARGAPGSAIVVGDFNATADVVARALGGDVAISDLSGQPPTRVPDENHLDGQTIDHVVIFGGSVASSTVLDAARLSDHRPVLAECR